MDKFLCEHVCSMCILKPYLDSLRSESDRSGFVVRFGLNDFIQKPFGPAFAVVFIKDIRPGLRKEGQHSKHH